MIPYGRQSINQKDIDQVINILKSDYLTQGPRVPEFEKLIQQYCSAEHAVAVNSATSALHLACLALGLGPGDSLWTTPNTFVASANCGAWCGATVDFVDIDPQTYNLSVPQLALKLEWAEQMNCLPKVIVPVHFTGQACDMAEINKLRDRYGFKVIEDASHAIGGSYHGQLIGNCHYSDITVFSFHPVKIITTGEGGVAVTNNQELAMKMSRLRTHGITRDPNQFSGPNQGDWYYEQIDLGFNYRMTDIAAGLGISQFDRLSKFVNRRKEIADNYNTGLSELPLILPYQAPGQKSAWHLYVVQVDSSKTAINRRTLFRDLRESGIGVNVHYIPVHVQPYYQSLGFKQGDFPEAERYYEQAISLPIHPSLTNAEQDQIINTMASKLE